MRGAGPPPLRPFGLVLHFDGRWSHEGESLRNRKLRELFDRSVRFLPEEGKFVVQVQHFRGEIEVEEAPFFVLEVDFANGRVRLSDRSWADLRPETLALSPIDGALMCRVKQDLVPAGLLARFRQGAQAELLLAVEEGQEGLGVRLSGRFHGLPEGLLV